MSFCKVVKMMGSVLCDQLWYCFTIDLYKYVSNIRQGQHSTHLGLLNFIHTNSCTFSYNYVSVF